MGSLTKRQQEVLNYIQDYIRLHHYSPSHQEILHHFHFSSLETVQKHIDDLKKMGSLPNDKDPLQSLIPSRETVPYSMEIELPFIGYIMGGEPIEMLAQIQTMAVPECLVHAPERTYVLRARGDSLREEMISDGDLLLVESKKKVAVGETVVGMVQNSKAFIKRYFPEGDRLRLKGFNSSLIVRSDEVVIQGALVGLIRLFQ